VRIDVGEAMYTRSSDAAMAAILLKSPMMVRSAGRQSRLALCARRDIGEHMATARISVRRARIGAI
jgi:hypothetical protein